MMKSNNMLVLSVLFSSFLLLACDEIGDVFNHKPKSPTSPTEITDVFYEERAKTISSIKQFSDENSVVLTILTDNHLSSSSINKEANEATLQNIAYVNKQVKTDGVVHLGDMIAESLYKTDGKSNDDLYGILNDYIKKVDALHEHTFIINGNHDGEKGRYFYQDRWLEIVSSLNSSYVKRKEGTPYFYYDIPGKGVRCVFMAVPDNDFDRNVCSGFSPRLLQWLKEEALVVEDGTDIIMFAHIPVIHANYYKSGQLPNRDTFEGLCNAFNYHTTFSDEIVNVDFSHSHNSRIVAYISGHAHTDLVAEPGWTYEGLHLYDTDGKEEPFTYHNSLSFPVVIIGRNYFNYNTDQKDSRMGGIIYSRSVSSASQDLWDVLVYNKSEGEIRLIRFGAGEDRIIKID